jgi:hypothetical protein
VSNQAEAMMQDQIEGAQGENERLRLENDELRKESERYRWVMSRLGSFAMTYRRMPGRAKQYAITEDGDVWGQWHDTPGAAIDAAMAAGK